MSGSGIERSFMGKLTVVLDDKLQTSATVEANRAHKGDLSAVVSAALSFYLHVQQGIRGIEAATPKQAPPAPAKANPSQDSKGQDRSQINPSAIRNVLLGVGQFLGLSAAKQILASTLNDDQLVAASLAADKSFSGKDLMDFAQRLMRIAQTMNANESRAK
jgi:hypothetical protein